LLFWASVRLNFTREWRREVRCFERKRGEEAFGGWEWLAPEQETLAMAMSLSLFSLSL